MALVLGKVIVLFVLLSGSITVFCDSLDIANLPLPVHPPAPAPAPGHHKGHHHHHPPVKPPTPPPVKPPTPPPVKPPSHPPVKPPTPPPFKPPTHPPVKPPTPPPVKPPTHPPVKPPTPPPVKPPTHPPVKPPTPPPLKPPTHPPVKPPTPPPVKPPTHPPVKPPSPPPAKPPTPPPAPYHPPARKGVAVQGVVYCKSCKYRGINTLLEASPLAGAIVKLQCNNTKWGVLEKTKTDKNGYFFFKPAKLSTAAFHKCKVFLVSSPSATCNIPTNLGGGLAGAPLIPSRKPQVKPLPFQLFSVGPFAFEPPKKVPCHL